MSAADWLRGRAASMAGPGALRPVTWDDLKANLPVVHREFLAEAEKDRGERRRSYDVALTRAGADGALVLQLRRARSGTVVLAVRADEEAAHQDRHHPPPEQRPVAVEADTGVRATLLAGLAALDNDPAWWRPGAVESLRAARAWVEALR